MTPLHERKLMDRWIELIAVYPRPTRALTLADLQIPDPVMNQYDLDIAEPSYAP